jgi:hypothetical protein
MGVYVGDVCIIPDVTVMPRHVHINYWFMKTQILPHDWEWWTDC